MPNLSNIFAAVILLMTGWSWNLQAADGGATLALFQQSCIKCHGNVFRGLKIRVTSANVGYKAFLAGGPQVGKALVDSIHPRASLSTGVAGSESESFERE